MEEEEEEDRKKKERMIKGDLIEIRKQKTTKFIYVIGILIFFRKKRKLFFLSKNGSVRKWIQLFPIHQGERIGN